ncbi:MAG: PKD domain-containing protein [Planctomycetota bacterium]|jgi:predicted CXXCH cytochrome family protein
MTGSTFISPQAQIGPDLLRHHPVSFTYDSILATVDGGLHDPATTLSGLGATIADDMLDGGKVECNSCHGLHADSGDPDLLLLPDEGGELCLTCHNVGDHTEVKGGFAEHKPGFGNPLDNGCTQCHGPSLDDGFAPSCFTCHGQIWAGAGPPADHTEVKGGFAEHKPGFGTPFSSGCTACHGTNLNGTPGEGGDGFAPSCYSCHGKRWSGENAPPTHTQVMGGFARHMPGLEDPVANGCTQCHGPNLNDGFAPSCFTCHEPLWESQNLPPDLDAGGPYQGVPGQSIAFDASGTFDPDGDTLTYEWDFGDGSPATSPSEEPTAAHTYADPGTYAARLTVTDGVNQPIWVDVGVDISDEPSFPMGDTWLVDIPFLLTQLTITIEDFDGFLVVEMILADGSTRFGIGVEFEGVIFWMEPSGALFLGNVNEDGTMWGIVFGYDGGSSVWFAEPL